MPKMVAGSHNAGSHSDRPANPFGSRFTTPGALSFCPDGNLSVGNVIEMDAEQFLSVLADKVAITPRALIVGPHGSGKSTLLHALKKELIRSSPPLSAAGSIIWITLRQGGSHAEVWSALARCPPGGLLMMDGSEQLWFWERMRVLVIARSKEIRLLWTSHRPLLGFSEIYRTRPHREVARRLAKGLLADFPQLQVEMMQEFDRRWPVCQGNIRELWATLYDHFEKQNIPQREGCP